MIYEKLKKLPRCIVYCPDCQAFYDKILLPLQCGLCGSENVEAQFPDKEFEE